MMQACEIPDCNRWAQWIVSGKDTDESKRKIKLCNAHKTEMMAHPLWTDQKAVFAGAIPKGS